MRAILENSVRRHVISSFTFDHHVVNVYFYDVANQWFENLGHQPLIRGPSVFEPKWHDFVTVEPVWGYEGGFFFILGCHRNLVILGESIQKI